MNKLLFYYSALASMLITASLVLTTNTLPPLIFAILFLPVTAYFVTEFFRQIRTGIEKAPKTGGAEVTLIMLIFIVLMGVSIRNVYINSTNKSGQETPSLSNSNPLIFSVSKPEPQMVLTVKSLESSTSAIIRKGPDVHSPLIGEAKIGDMFTYTATNSGWYKIELAGGFEGFINSKYVEILK